MDQAETNEQREIIIARVCYTYSISPQTAYRRLHALGWRSDRNARKDAGNTAMTPENLAFLSAMLKEGIRKNKKQTLSVTDARAIMLENGYDIPIKDSRLRQLLRENHLSTADAANAAPYQRMRSRYPNHIHLADPSTSLLYYSPGGNQKIIRDSEEYKNKSFLKDKEKCLRYVLVDHYSHSICVRYYSAPGETAENMYHFLLYAWGKKSLDLYDFHGLPETLVWDHGSANMAEAVTNALLALRVRTIPHLPENPRAKGSVEKANDIVERKFESRLRFEPVRSIEELNDAVERWCAAYNANMIPHTDCRLRRGSMKPDARLLIWRDILATPENLRELPDPEICRQIYGTRIQTRKVQGDLAVSMVHPKTGVSMRYSLVGIKGIFIGQTVNIQPILVDPEPKIKVFFKDDTTGYEVSPIAYDRRGFDLDAPVYGESYQREPDTVREQNAKRLDKLAAGKIPFGNITNGEGLKAHSFIKAESPFIKPTAGEQIIIAASRIEVHEILISHFDAAIRVKARNGWIAESFIERMKREYPEGVPESRIDDIAHDEAAVKGAVSI
jgi:hypothetical protein